MSATRAAHEPGTITWFLFVPHGDRARREAQGWVAEANDLGPVHGFWSVLMRWAGPGDPPDSSDRRCATGAPALEIAA